MAAIHRETTAVSPRPRRLWPFSVIALSWKEADLRWQLEAQHSRSA
jgi:hypothetical protein